MRPGRIYWSIGIDLLSRVVAWILSFPDGDSSPHPTR